MTLPRPSTEHERLAIKASVRRALALAGSVTSFAAITRVNPPALSNYGAPSEADKHIPADVILDLDREAGAIVTAELARLLGFRLAAADGPGGSLDHADAFAMVERATAAAAVLSRSLADGRIDGAEAREIAIRLDEATALMQDVSRRLRGHRFGGGGE